MGLFGILKAVSDNDDNNLTKEEKEEADSIPVSSLLVNRDQDTSNEYQAFIDYVLKDVEEKTGINPFKKPVKIYRKERGG